MLIKMGGRLFAKDVHGYTFCCADEPHLSASFRSGDGDVERSSAIDGNAIHTGISQKEEQ